MLSVISRRLRFPPSIAFWWELILILALAALVGGVLLPCPAIAAPPTVTEVTPLSANQGETIDVTVTGTNFTEDTSLSFGEGIQLNTLVLVSDAEIRASVTVADDARSGIRDISVSNPGGISTLGGGFEVPPPIITSIVYREACQGDTVQIVIRGKNLYGTSEIDLGSGVTVEHFSADDPDQITATLQIAKTATTGDRNIVVTTPSGTTTLHDEFTISGPDAVSVHTWILAALVGGLVLGRLALFGLFRRKGGEAKEAA